MTTLQEKTVTSLNNEISKQKDTITKYKKSVKDGELLLSKEKKHG